MIAASPERPNSERDDRFSTRDLLGYLLCRHATWRDIQRTIDPGHFERPIVLNDELRKMRSHADRLLDPEVADVDGNVETRKGTVSVFNGPTPLISVAADQKQEGKAVEQWINARLAAGFLPHEIGVFVRSDAQIPRATAALERTSLAYRVLDQKVTSATGYVSVATMHLAKGLEFRGVAVMACDDEIVPLQERLQEVGDDADLKYVYETERHLLYVACTRARDELLITAVSPESEFLVDLTRKR